MTSRTLLRLLSAGAAAAAGIALAVAPAVASSGSHGDRGEHGRQTVPVRLLSINDLHGNLEPPSGSSSRILDPDGPLVDTDGTLTGIAGGKYSIAGGVSYLATHIKQAQNRNTLLLAAGDLIGASPLISAAYHDEPTLEVLGSLGLDTTSAGNHEFDEGYTELRRLMNGGCHPVDGCSPAGEWKGTDFDFLAANVLKEGTDQYALPPYYVKTINGVKVGFIGLVTATTPTIVTAEGIKGLQFTEEVAAANRASAHLARKGVKAQVVLVHEGDSITPNQSPDACSVNTANAGSRIARELSPQIDLVISGHSHQAYICKTADPAGQDRYYTQGSSFGRVLTQIDLQIDKRTKDVIRSSVQADNKVVTRTVTPDQQVEQQVQAWKARSAEVADRKLGTITADISNVVNNSSAATTKPETALGDLIADSQLEAAKAGGAEIALMNPGGIRTSLTYAQKGSEGDGVVTYGEAFEVQPFSNIVQVRTYTGAQLKALLEQQVWTPNPTTGAISHRILQVSSSLTYTFDTTKPVGSRVSDIKLNGTPVTDTQSIKIAANNFLMGGGDGFSVFTQSSDTWSGPIDLDTFTAYLGAHSPISPSPADRITFIK
ncbi:bifunctional metallophosphatase/5'-nucleotidase [Nonomuraea gerenzanensis]|uniref:5'-nucleotidase n=1 Tax=Nonomuraea gerenzanensis TaxID=93944 RepID=A0A1M4DYX1_9ACTN|nr:bifunctional metallophosphatase/5'-nucleotidase [Nonomuraea gerenzanensis]UBU14084.1 bifunctional metallophosphatase/5'-nucleotidase [Nonomuraea gerenzanensis]SBO91775.1 5'-nucleotidase [Nonomuraea gerenzanensis]